jgi:hypothetical protein
VNTVDAVHQDRHGTILNGSGHTVAANEAICTLVHKQLARDTHMATK